MEIIPTLVSVLGAIISTVALVRARRSEVRTREAEERARFLAEAGHLADQYDKLRVWGDRVLQRLTDAIETCDLDPERAPPGEFFGIRHRLLADLSALADQGRLFLPNTDADTYGTEKEGAFRGLRVAALSEVVKSYRLIKKMDYRSREPNRNIKKGLVKAKRQFVSHLQDHLSVRKRQQELRLLSAHLRLPEGSKAE